MRLDFHPKARAEYRQAVEFYKAESMRLGREFAVEARAAIDSLLATPEAGSPDVYGTRRKLVRQFPFVIVYEVVGDVLRIIAFMHQRRKPGYWTSRL